MIDAVQGISDQDAHIAGFILEAWKSVVVVVNKWDLMTEHMPTERWADYLRETFPSMWHVPIAFITGQAGKNVKRFGSKRELFADLRS